MIILTVSHTINQPINNGEGNPIQKSPFHSLPQNLEREFLIRPVFLTQPLFDLMFSICRELILCLTVDMPN